MSNRTTAVADLAESGQSIVGQDFQTPAGGVIDAVLDALASVPAVRGKLYHAEALKGATAPFVFWLQTGERYEEDLNGPTELEEARYEFHTVAKNLDSLNKISRAVRNAILPLQGQTKGGILFEHVVLSQISPVINEHEVNLYRKVYEITINYQEV